MGGGVGQSFNLSGTVGQAISGMAGGIAGAAATSLVTGRDFGDTIMSQLPSIIGNTIGNMLAGAVAGSGRSGGSSSDSGAGAKPQPGAGGGQVGNSEASEPILVEATRGAALSDDEFDARQAARDAEYDRLNAPFDAEMAADLPDRPDTITNFEFREQAIAGYVEWRANVKAHPNFDPAFDAATDSNYRSVIDSLPSSYSDAEVSTAIAMLNGWGGPSGSGSISGLASTGRNFQSFESASYVNGWAGGGMSSIQYGLVNSSYGSGKIHWQIGQGPFYGNQHVGRTVQWGRAVSGGAEILGKGSFGVGVGIDAFRYAQDDPEMPGSKLFLNIGMGAAGLIGPFGAVVAGSYFIADAVIPESWGREVMKHNTNVELKRLKYGHGPKY